MTVTTEPTVLYLDPAALVTNGNVRADLGDLTELTASVKENGVLVPLLVVPNHRGDGSDTYTVVAGHRRRAAAVEAGVARVPCLVRPDLEGVAPTVVAQLAENEHRRGLTVAERVAAHQQLKMEGLSQAAIAKATATKPAQVKRLLAVAGSETATLALADHAHVTLEQAAVLAEFDADDEAREHLVTILTRQPGQWDHAVSRIRQDRKTARAQEKRIKELSDQGVTCFRDDSEVPEGAKRADRLYGDNDEMLTDHSDCPGRAVLVTTDWYNELTEREYCLDPDGNGHKIPSWMRGGGSATATKSDEDKSAERKEVLANNKAWRAATPVRRAYVKTLLAAKKLPDGALRYAIADAVTHPSSMSTNKEDLLAEFLGVEQVKTLGYWEGKPTAKKAAEDATEARLPFVLLAHVAAAHETPMDVHVWRNGDRWQADWLTFLKGTGYELSDVEQVVITKAAEETEKRSRWNRQAEVEDAEPDAVAEVEDYDPDDDPEF